MDLAWFVYTIAVIFVAVVASAVSLTVWVLTDRKSWVVAAAAFGCYVFETAIILFSEYSGEKLYLQDYFNGGLEYPIVTIPLCVALLTLVWTWVALRVHAPVTTRRVVGFCAAALAAAVLVAPIGLRAGTLHTLLYWVLRDLTVIAALVFGALYVRFRATENERDDALRAKPFWRVALALAILMLCEDVFFVGVWTPDATQSELVHSFFWHLTERNISENVLMTACAVRQIQTARDVMRVFARHPAENISQAEPDDRRRVESDIDIKIPVFADDHGMSPREREVLRLLLLQKTTQEIANELYLSVGTVKAHSHRIYQKAGVTSRQDLIRAFWRS